MRINKLNVPNLSFKAARINIVANSDNHGNITSLPEFYETIKKNEDEIFQKSDEKSTLNIFINAGDYFINGAKQGYRTDPSLTNLAVQKDFLQLLISKVKKVANTKQYAKELKASQNPDDTEAKLQHPVKFEAIYTPGNHCFDAGDKMLYDSLRDIDDLTVIMTNIDAKKSKAFDNYDFDKDGSKFVTSKEFEIPDDKYEHKKHHLMLLGVTIPAMDFYNPGLLDETNFCDENDIKDSQMTKDNISGTIAAIKAKTLDFKERYPDGIIMLLSHMGTKLSKMIRDEVPQINEILDGHKHDVATFKKGNCSVSSLGQDNQIIKSIAYQIDDFGEIERESYVYTTSQYRLEGNATNAINRMLKGSDISGINKRNCYKKEFDPIVHIYDTNAKENFYGFQYNSTIRYSNSFLANFLTSSIKEAIKEIKGLEDTDLVAIQSSVIRGGISDGACNFDIMKIFDGVSEKLSNVKVGNITGEELFYIVLENIKSNIKDKTRNTIIHWSDLQIDRKKMEDLFKKYETIFKSANKKEGISGDFELIMEQTNKQTNDERIAELKAQVEKDFKDTVKIRNKSGEFEPLDFNKSYKIAIADKYLTKTDIVMPNLIRNRFESKAIEKTDKNGQTTQIPMTYHTLFAEFLNNPKKHIKSKDFPVHVRTNCSTIIDYTTADNDINRLYVNDNYKEIRIID